MECEDEEEVLHPEFVQLNPDDLNLESDLFQKKKAIRNIEIKSHDEILKEARQLDKFQKKILHVGINFAQNS